MCSEKTLVENCQLQLTLKLGGATSGRGPKALRRVMSFSLVRLSEACGRFHDDAVTTSFRSSTSDEPLLRSTLKARVGPGRACVPMSMIGIALPWVGGAIILAELETDSLRMSSASRHRGLWRQRRKGKAGEYVQWVNSSLHECQTTDKYQP